MSDILYQHIAGMLKRVEHFQREVISPPIPDTPTKLTGEARERRIEHLQEELDEFAKAETLEDQLDALIDLIYVGLGGVVEMGIPPDPPFATVHACNMQKHRGWTARGRDNDAAKPEGWLPPNFEAYLSINRQMIERMLDREAMTSCGSVTTLVGGRQVVVDVRSREFKTDEN